MAIKRKLTDMLAPRHDETVHIHVPAVDPAEDLIQGSLTFMDRVREVVAERDNIKTLNEQLNRKCVFLQKTNERLERELALCRKQTNEYIRRNGKIVGIAGGARAALDSIYDEAMEAQALNDALPPDTAPQPHAVYDTNGMPMDVPAEVTLEDLQTLSTALARAGD